MDLYNLNKKTNPPKKADKQITKQKQNKKMENKKMEEEEEEEQIIKDYTEIKNQIITNECGSGALKFVM